jgi:hypothetical protein
MFFLQASYRATQSIMDDGLYRACIINADENFALLKDACIRIFDYLTQFAFNVCIIKRYLLVSSYCQL